MDEQVWRRTSRKAKCHYCMKELEIPGALLFGPITGKFHKCRKIDICVDCFGHIEDIAGLVNQIAQQSYEIKRLNGIIEAAKAQGRPE